MKQKKVIKEDGKNNEKGRENDSLENNDRFEAHKDYDKSIGMIFPSLA